MAHLYSAFVIKVVSSEGEGTSIFPQFAECSRKASFAESEPESEQRAVSPGEKGREEGRREGRKGALIQKRLRSLSLLHSTFPSEGIQESGEEGEGAKRMALTDFLAADNS